MDEGEAAHRLPGGWSGRWDSNPRPAAWEAATLPLSYSRLVQLYYSTSPSLGNAPLQAAPPPYVRSTAHRRSQTPAPIRRPISKPHPPQHSMPRHRPEMPAIGAEREVVTLQHQATIIAQRHHPLHGQATRHAATRASTTSPGRGGRSQYTSRLTSTRSPSRSAGSMLAPLIRTRSRSSRAHHTAAAPATRPATEHAARRMFYSFGTGLLLDLAIYTLRGLPRRGPTLLRAQEAERP